ncbi:excinuclease ABC subunit UvrC [Euzebya pacifica]|jgi:excinuclease ABC subunit C|uniref:excinuclease ABC subunit UvrC n=1 Tax=Euzebya pacifica TaxID=1608957 RepID=UPI0030FB6E47
MVSNPALSFRPDPGTIPTDPGCYLWRDRHGRVVYVGKAKNLRARLSSYFQDVGNLHQRTRGMLEVAASVEWIIVASDVESLHLEYNLIKQHRPRFNVRYNDDKSYPYLAITLGEEVPRAMVRRNPRNDGSRYFGPFAHAYAIRDTLDMLLRVYPVRTCSKGVFDRHQRAGRPCLLFHIGKCSGPCTGEVSPEEHLALVEDLMAFVDGDTEGAVEALEAAMASEAEKQNYEAAARIRDQLKAMRTALAKQVMVTGKREDLDAISWHADELEVAFQVFFVRNGRVVGRKGWTVDRVEALDMAGLVQRFMVQVYSERAHTLGSGAKALTATAKGGADGLIKEPEGDATHLVGKEVLVPELPEDHETLEELLSELRGSRVVIRVPQRGAKRAFLDTVEENAREAFQQHRLKRAKDFNARSQALKELQEGLGLEQAPLRIECYDISTLQGTNSVASMVVMEDGLPRKSEYRRFRINGVVGQDDFAMMHEVITRRFKRYLAERDLPLEDEDGKPRKFAYPPNLVLIDGGKGQLNAANRALEELGIEGVELASLAKKMEEVFRPGRSESVMLPRSSEALFLVMRIRDEAHRFAITYHRSLRGKEMVESVFDEIPGVGPARRKALLGHFGTVRAMKEATVADLEEVPGISEGLARTIHDHLRPGRRRTPVER